MNRLSGRVLLTGATGFVGGRLGRALINAGIRPRALTRSVKKFRGGAAPTDGMDVVKADLLEPESLAAAMEGIDAAFYLVHSMGGRTFSENRLFAERDRRAAHGFVKAADRAGVKRIIYMGGLGEVGEGLSEHLSSRQEVARILKSGSAKTTVLRAANIIGAGGAPFEMLRHLVERLPVLLCPRWIDTPCQPIDVEDAVAYLVGCLRESATEGLDFDVGGPDVVTYRKMMQLYARVRGLRRLIVSVPVLTPRLSALWIDLVTPVPSGVAVPLLEGLKNEVVCRDNRIRKLVPIPLTPLDVSICNALVQIRSGPGRLPSRQACFIRDDA